MTTDQEQPAVKAHEPDQVTQTDRQELADKAERPRWLRVLWRICKPLIIPLLCLIGLYVGLIIGYVHFGKQPASGIDLWSTWKHVIDLVFA